MKYQTMTIPLTSPPDEYPLKKNIKSLSVIGIEYNQSYVWELVKITINGNMEYFIKVGKMIYFQESGIYVESIRITALYSGGSEIATRSTIIFEEVTT